MRLLAIFLFIWAGMDQCATEQETFSQDEEMRQLQIRFDEILKISESVKCEGGNDWKFTAIGSKACGGPSGYIAYSKSIDEAAFLQKVESYTAAVKTFNEKWGATSDCSLVTPPSAVGCEDGKAVLIYDSGGL